MRTWSVWDSAPPIWMTGMIGDESKRQDWYAELGNCRELLSTFESTPHVENLPDLSIVVLEDVVDAITG